MKMNVRRKIMGCFLIVTLVFGSASLVSYQTMKSTNATYDYLVDVVIQLRANAQSIETNSALQTGYYRAFMLYGQEEHRVKLNETNDTIVELIAQSKQLATLDETRRRFDEIAQINADYKRTASEIMESASVDKEKAVAAGLVEVAPLGASIVNKSQDLNQWLSDEILAPRVAEARATSQSGLVKILALSAAAALIAALGGIILARFIAKPLVRLEQFARLVSEGRLDVEPPAVGGQDEIHLLNESLRRMSQNLRATVQGIADNAAALAASAQQLSSGAEQSGHAAESVASSVTEIAERAGSTTIKLNENSDALHEISQGASRISAGSGEILELSRRMTLEAKEGGLQVDEGLAQMQFIRDSIYRSNQVIEALHSRSQQIDGILGVIGTLASQTNLLALNASIEAARAGEAGRGFAVVAGEVGKLAEQSQNSARSIGELIAEIQKDTAESVHIMNEVMTNAEDGVNLSERTQQKFSGIMADTQSMTPYLEEMAATINQISASISEASSASSTIAGLAGHSAAASENAAAATEEQLASMQEISSSAQALASMAEELNELTGKFKL